MRGRPESACLGIDHGDSPVRALTVCSDIFRKDRCCEIGCRLLQVVETLAVGSAATDLDIE